DCPEHGLTGALDPLSVDRRAFAGRHLPGGLEAAEMIDANDVNLIEHVAEPSDPPRVVFTRHGPPVIEGIAPQLAGYAEVVGWHAGNDHRLPRRVQLEQVLMSPNIGAVMGDK